MGAANSKKREVAFVDACARGDTAEAMLLLDKAPAKHRPKLLGAYSVHTHMHLRSVQRKSALAVAALGGHTETAMALLDAGADIDLKVGSHGFSALMWACYRGHADVVQALIDRRADLEVESYPEKEVRGGAPAEADTCAWAAHAAAEVLPRDASAVRSLVVVRPLSSPPLRRARLRCSSSSSRLAPTCTRGRSTATPVGRTV